MVMFNASLASLMNLSVSFKSSDFFEAASNISFQAFFSSLGAVSSISALTNSMWRRVASIEALLALIALATLLFMSLQASSKASSKATISAVLVLEVVAGLVT